MEKLLKCPYSCSVSKGKSLYRNIREDYTLQYNEYHEVEAVKVGETDILKEINSHVNEVGLVNVMKLAIAHGENPYTKFAKYEDGVPFAVDPNATLDDIQNLQKQNNDKLAELAKTLGLSVDDLAAKVNDGSIGDYIKNYHPEQSTQDGGAD